MELLAKMQSKMANNLDDEEDVVEASCMAISTICSTLDESNSQRLGMSSQTVLEQRQTNCARWKQSLLQHVKAAKISEIAHRDEMRELAALCPVLEEILVESASLAVAEMESSPQVAAVSSATFLEALAVVCKKPSTPEQVEVFAGRLAAALTCRPFVATCIGEILNHPSVETFLRPAEGAASPTFASLQVVMIDKIVSEMAAAETQPRVSVVVWALSTVSKHAHSPEAAQSAFASIVRSLCTCCPAPALNKNLISILERSAAWRTEERGPPANGHGKSLTAEQSWPIRERIIERTMFERRERLREAIAAAIRSA